MGPYSTLTDAELLAEIKEYQQARKDISMGGVAAVVAGEGRRIEFTRSNSSGISTALRELYAEGASRGLTGFGHGGSAIPVRIH